jgi:NAD(P)-dependent dehydrogenase (short-subunit alcohol dehydrogenase family)
MNGVLADRVVAVAGATGGLGPSVVRALADAGAVVALTDREQGALDTLAGECALPDDRVDARVVDLLDEAAARGWAEHLVARFGRVDALLHLVGGWRGGTPLEDAPLDDWALLHDLLIRTVQHTTRAFSAPLRASGSGRFALVSSKQAQAPTHDNAAYAAAKAAAEAWTLALADGFTGTGATANVVVVNAIATPGMLEGKAPDAFPTFTRAAELAAALVWISSEGSGAMNGQRLALHGSGVRG